MSIASKMNIKKVFVIGTAAFVLVCFCLFYVMNSALPFRQSGKVDYALASKHLMEVQEALGAHKASLIDIETFLESKTSLKKEYGQKWHPESDKHEEEDSKLSCSSAYHIEPLTKSDVDMLDVYKILPFDDPKGGAWTQGWDVQIDHSRFHTEDKLKVFVIPHSHNDPGWIKTYQEYFEAQTRHILNSMLEKLQADPSVKFIWAEISYFSTWWDELNQDSKDAVRRLVQNKQLEFVTGGWVMPDESSTDYYALLVQMIEGHQWLLHHLAYVPKNGWSIDPFGMSPTQAYILKRTGISNMLVQRTHYAVKKYLAQHQDLEFHWRQRWDAKGSADMFCHMMPFYSYDVPHTCGPDPSVCCQFDFKRMRGVSPLSCPWRKPVQPIVQRNVKERALLLLDQYRKKSMLYRTNVLLVPLGDDFRWENKKEWDAQTENYQRLMEYINSQSELQAEVQFGTLDDYFKELHERMSVNTVTPNTLSGDFFTYSDRNDHYWSGYFTSRPFHKSMDRRLSSILRSAQLAFSLMLSQVSKSSQGVQNYKFARELLGKLRSSRRHLSLFQHHDGIAGTAKDHVMEDYAGMLYTAMKDCEHVIHQSLFILSASTMSHSSLSDLDPGTLYYLPTVTQEAISTVPRPVRIMIDREFSRRKLTIFNPTPSSRIDLVKVHVSTYDIEVVDSNGNVLDHDIMPVFDNDGSVSMNIFELQFVIDSKSLSAQHFSLNFKKRDMNSLATSVLLHNAPMGLATDHSFFTVSQSSNTENIILKNDVLSAEFDTTGFLSAVTTEGQKLMAQLRFLKYGAEKRREETSGLYLFFPDGEAVPVYVGTPFVKVVHGKFESFVETKLKNVLHRVTVSNYEGSSATMLDIRNEVDIRQERNFELAMRLESSVDSSDTFFTDLNGFQIIQRKRLKKLPLQGNYYPVPTTLFVEDNTWRVSLIANQPQGGSSLNPGELEVMMDRRLMQDDNRGAGQGCTDNSVVPMSFKLLFEKKHCEDTSEQSNPPMMSLLAQHLHHNSQNPLVVSYLADAYENTDLTNYAIDGAESLPCDIQLTGFFPLPEYSSPLDDSSYIVKPSTAVIVRRLGFDSRFPGNFSLFACQASDAKLGKFNLKSIMGDLTQSSVQQSTLSFLVDGRTILPDEVVYLKPMELYAFIIKHNK